MAETVASIKSKAIRNCSGFTGQFKVSISLFLPDSPSVPGEIQYPGRAHVQSLSERSAGGIDNSLSSAFVKGPAKFH